MPKITIEPYEGPYNVGQDAYTYNGVQMLKSRVDKMSPAALYTGAKRSREYNIPDEKNLFLALYRMATGESDLPEPCHVGDGC